MHTGRSALSVAHCGTNRFAPFGTTILKRARFPGQPGFGDCMENLFLAFALVPSHNPPVVFIPPANPVSGFFGARVRIKKQELSPPVGEIYQLSS